MSECPYRPFEDNIKKDFSNDMSYGKYLHIDELLTLQTPLSKAHDETLFIIIHQVKELWIKLMFIEIEKAMQCIKEDDYMLAQKVLARASNIFDQLLSSWKVLTTMTPVDYMTFRDFLGNSSGFQSYGYRMCEFALGNKDEQMLEVHKHNTQVYDTLKTLLHSPSIYDLLIQKLYQQGLPIDKELLNKDFTKPHTPNKSLENAWMIIYQNTKQYWEIYELAEQLMDIDYKFNEWRFKHMQTVERIIGFKTGTGGSSGVKFLKQMVDKHFFPELWTLRTSL